MEELLAKVRILREQSMLGKGQVKYGNPFKTYVWVNKNENRLNYYISMGYVICHDPKVATSWKQADGTHVRGDVILMEIDKDLHDAIKFDGELRAVESVGESKGMFEAYAASKGIPVKRIA